VVHSKLKEILGERIADPNIISLIGRFLKAGIMEEGKYYETDKGTPQGGVLSPILSNIYLHHCLDRFFEEDIRKSSEGFCQLIRYADDFVVCFQKVKDAASFHIRLRGRFREYGLSISEKKSKVLPFGRCPHRAMKKKGKRPKTFDFLGFTHYCTETRKGAFKLGQKTAKAKFRLRIKELNQWLKSVRSWVKLKEWWEVLRAKLTGHYRYYGISGNMAEMHAYYTEAVRLAFKWINRRSQKKSCNWEKFKKFIRDNPLPMPKIYHSFYTLSPKREGYTEEPDVGKLQVRFCEGH